MLGRFSIGFKLLLLYSVIFYVPQFFFSMVFSDYYSIEYRGLDMRSLVPALIILFLIITLLVEKTLPKFKFRYAVGYKTVLIFRLTFLLFSLLFFVISVYFSINYGIDFRHNGPPILESGGQIVLLWFLKEISRFYLFFLLIKRINAIKISNLEIAALLFFGLGWMLSITASFEIPFIVILAFVLFAPSSMWIKEKNFKEKFQFNKLILITSILILPIVAIFFGYANKIGFDRAILLFSDADQIMEVLMHVIRRVSSSFASASNAISSYAWDIDFQIETTIKPLNKFLERLDILLGRGVIDYTEGLNTVSRVNYLNLYQDAYLPISGASPGLYASVLMIPFFPINILIFSIFVVFINKAFSRYFPNIRGSMRLSPLAYFSLFYFYYYLFDSPIDLLKFIDPYFLYFMLMVLFSRYFQSILFYKNADNMTIKNKK